jgi:hypothetical protein
MTRAMLAIIAMLLSNLSANAQVITLSCDGKAITAPLDTNTKVETTTITGLGLVINLKDRQVTDFPGAPAHITEITAAYVAFEGKRDDGFYVCGHVDRVTGRAFAETGVIDPKTGWLDFKPPNEPVFRYLNCQPTRPLF